MIVFFILGTRARATSRTCFHFWREICGSFATTGRDSAGRQMTESHRRLDTSRLLHDALAAAGVARPYVLVGHSLGGTRIRMFAGVYPNEVAGLVFVDPTPPQRRPCHPLGRQVGS